MPCVFAKTVYTGKSLKKNVYVNFSGKRIVSVSSSPRGTCLGKLHTVTPAFIDPHNHIGMRRAGEPGSEGESNEKMGTIIPVSDALDSIQMDDTSFSEAIETGVLYSCAVPGSGNVIGGRSAVIRNYASDTTSALITRAGIKSAFGYNPMSTTEWKGTRPTTRMGNIALLRSRLDEIKHKKSKQSLSMEDRIIADLLKGKEYLRCHVHKIDDIAALLRIVDEFGIKIIIEHACDVHQPGIFNELRKRSIAVTYGPVDAFAYKVELKHAHWRNIKLLLDSGIDFGLMTDHPVTPCRTLFLQTRWFTRCGCSKQEAIEIVTRRNARILGIHNILGTLAKGRWASIIGWNGDPFDLTSFPEIIIAEGNQLNY